MRREIKNQDESKSLNAAIDSENKNDETIQTKDDEESAEPKVATSVLMKIKRLFLKSMLQWIKMKII